MGFGILLALVLAVRLYRNESVVLDTPGDDNAHVTGPGANCPFYKVIETLAATGFTRDNGESLVRWVGRIGHPELIPLVTQHYRRRFDPAYTQGNDAGDVLGEEVNIWLARQQAQHTDSDGAVSGWPA